jgi:hypothetical protein
MTSETSSFKSSNNYHINTNLIDLIICNHTDITQLYLEYKEVNEIDILKNHIINYMQHIRKDIEYSNNKNFKITKKGNIYTTNLIFKHDDKNIIFNIKIFFKDTNTSDEIYEKLLELKIGLLTLKN